MAATTNRTRLIERAEGEVAARKKQWEATLASISGEDRRVLARRISQLMDQEVVADDLRLTPGYDGHWNSHYDLEAGGMRFHAYFMWEGSFHGHAFHLWWLRDDGSRRRIEFTENFAEPVYDEADHADECDGHRRSAVPSTIPSLWRRIFGAD